MPNPIARRALRLVQPVLLVIAILVGLAAVDAGKPVVVATIDMDRLFDNIDAAQAIDAKVVRVKAELAARLDVAKAEFKELQEDLESFAPGTPAHDHAADTARAKAGELRALEAFAEHKMQAAQGEGFRDLYVVVKQVAAEVAGEQGIDIVFVDDASMAIRATDLQGTMQQISARRMLFANAALDLTDVLTQRVNAALKARAGG